VLSYFLIRKFDVFRYESSKMVAVREHTEFNATSLATAGVVETKQFDAAVSAGVAKAEELRKLSGPSGAAGLQRLSAAMAEPKLSMVPGLGRRSMVAAPGAQG